MTELSAVDKSVDWEVIVWRSRKMLFLSNFYFFKRIYCSSSGCGCCVCHKQRID